MRITTWILKYVFPSFFYFYYLNTNVIFQAETARVVWSYHSQDPSSLTQLGSLVHQEKGSASLNLLGGSVEDRVETNSASFSITSDNVCCNKDKLFRLYLIMYITHNLGINSIPSRHYLLVYSS